MSDDMSGGDMGGSVPDVDVSADIDTSVEDTSVDIPADIPEDEPEALDDDMSADIPGERTDVEDTTTDTEGDKATEEIDDTYNEQLDDVATEGDSDGISHEIPEDNSTDVTKGSNDFGVNKTPSDSADDVPESTALNRMSEYMNSHNYGREDYATYSQDPEWISINRDLKTENGIPQTAQEKMADYMGSHNYGQEDFDTYSRDPEWIGINRDLKAELGIPQTAQEKLADYMGSHDYGLEDFDTYSQDPEWRALQQEAYPDYELPSLESKEYMSIVESLNDANVDYRPIEPASEYRSPDDIINHLGGGDLTEGSCSSLAFAYAGNKAGFDVLDFRDGESRSYFASNDSIESIANLPDINSKTISGTDDIYCANELLNGMDAGKEYYLATGLHASIVRNTGDGFEFLELQSATDNGWKTLDDDVLRYRFGCVSNNSEEYPNFLMDVDSLGRSAEFRDILGYINTAEYNQVKGVSGHVR